jgi:hypothetical protein
MRPRSQRIIAVILAAFIFGIVGYIFRDPFDFQFDFGSVVFGVSSRPAPVWVQLLTGLLGVLSMAVIFLILWWRRRKQH